MASKRPSRWNTERVKKVAHNKLNQAVRSGQLIRPDHCEVCGRHHSFLHAHHYKGYEHPVDVWFVCPTCNGSLHIHDGSQTKEQAQAQMRLQAATGGKQVATKTDNHNPEAKLELRRHFLRKYHAEGSIHVLDCCQGNGLLWSVLRQEFPITSYWGVDLKPKKGRLKIDSARILEQKGWTQNVVDIDTYGLPWKHFLPLLQTMTQPTTVFLTIGKVASMGSFILSKIETAILGLSPIKANIPNAFGAKLSDLATSYLLSMSCDYGIITTDAVEALPFTNARYIGVRLEPAQKERPAVAAASLSQPPQE